MRKPLHLQRGYFLVTFPNLFGISVLSIVVEVSGQKDSGRRFPLSILATKLSIPFTDCFPKNNLSNFYAKNILPPDMQPSGKYSFYGYCVK